MVKKPKEVFRRQIGRAGCPFLVIRESNQDKPGHVKLIQSDDEGHIIEGAIRLTLTEADFQKVYKPQ